MIKDLTTKMLLETVADHKLTILKDDELYRHLRIKKDGSRNRYYEIITFPGGLLIRGDMGTYEFERVSDMFNFFRSGVKNDGTISINPEYWGEKCESYSRFRKGIKEFSYDLFKAQIGAWFNDFYEDEDSSKEKRKCGKK